MTERERFHLFIPPATKAAFSAAARARGMPLAHWLLEAGERMLEEEGESAVSHAGRLRAAARYLEREGFQ